MALFTQTKIHFAAKLAQTDSTALLVQTEQYTTAVFEITIAANVFANLHQDF